MPSRKRTRRGSRGPRRSRRTSRKRYGAARHDDPRLTFYTAISREGGYPLHLRLRQNGWVYWQEQDWGAHHPLVEELEGRRGHQGPTLLCNFTPLSLTTAFGDLVTGATDVHYEYVDPFRDEALESVALREPCPSAMRVPLQMPVSRLQNNVYHQGNKRVPRFYCVTVTRQQETVHVEVHGGEGVHDEQLLNIQGLFVPMLCDIIVAILTNGSQDVGGFDWNKVDVDTLVMDNSNLTLPA